MLIILLTYFDLCLASLLYCRSPHLYRGGSKIWKERASGGGSPNWSPGGKFWWRSGNNSTAAGHSLQIILQWCNLENKSSAVAEMGDRLVTIDRGRKVWGGADLPLSVGELGRYLTQCCLDRGLPPYQVVSWSIQPFVHNTPTLQTDSSIGRTVTCNGRPKTKTVFVNLALKLVVLYSDERRWSEPNEPLLDLPLL